MNKQELIKEIKGLPYLSDRIVLDLIKQLDEPQLLKLKDIISRMKQLFPLSRAEWIDEILKEFGEEFGEIKYRSGYDQGLLDGAWVGNQLKDADKIRQELNKPVVKQFIADWYEENKDGFEGNLYRFSYNSPSTFDGAKLNEFERWFLTAGTKPFQTLVNMHQFGYEVEKEKRYLVKVKGICGNHETLNREKHSNKWLFSDREENSLYGTHHTRKELEDAGFGEVFNSPLFEVEEV